DPWDLWFITASNNAGIVPNQNPIEAHHSSIKKVAAGHLRVAISHVLAATLPKILIDCGRDRSMISITPIKTFAPEPINEDIYVAAKALCKSKNHYPRHKGKTKHAIDQIQRYYFSADYYVVNHENLYGVKVTKAIEPPFMKSGARYWDMYFKKREEKVTMAVEQLSNTINYSFRMPKLTEEIRLVSHNRELAHEKLKSVPASSVLC
ncbi:hypothetical protein PHMEG_00037670, partial [Phytophthora megakarya]